MSDSFVVSSGEGVWAITPGEGFQSELSLTYAELRDLLLTHEKRAKKDGPYISRPMTKGDKSRSDKNAGSWRLLPLDVDGLKAEELPLLTRWCEESKLKGFLTSTFSHRTDAPRIRLWLLTSRETTADEHPFLFRAMTQLVPFKLDNCVAKPSQPVFLPSCPEEHAAEALSFEIEGEPLDADRLLDSYRAELANASNKDGYQATGVRQPGGVIELFNKNVDLVELVQKHGYRPKSRGRFCAPNSHSGRAAVVMYEHALVSFHDPAHDPLAVRNPSTQQARLLDPFAVSCILEHKNDFKQAFRAAERWVKERGLVATRTDSSPAPSAAPAPIPLLLSPVDLYSSLKPQDMLVEGMLERAAVVIAAGDSNSGKTTALQYLALQIARGEWFGTKRTKQGRVLWIAGEDIENAKYRVVAMCEEFGIDPAHLSDQFLLMPQSVAVLQPESMDALATAVEQRVGAGTTFAAVFLDSKSVNWGGMDENSNDENAAFVQALRERLGTRFGGAAVVVLHHLTKQKETESRSSRGASSLINNADHEWRFEMNQDARITAMKPGSKVRLERWPEQRFAVKTVELPRAKFPHLENNFSEMPRVSVAEPINQHNRPLRAIQADADLRAVLLSFIKLVDAQQPSGITAVAEDLFWSDKSGKPDYRKVKRLMETGIEQKLLSREGKGYKVTSAARDFVALDQATAATGTD